MIEQWQRRQMAENVRHVIERDGRSVRCVAAAAGVAESTLRAWASGASVPNAVQLKELSVVLGVGVEVMLAGVNRITRTDLDNSRRY